MEEEESPLSLVEAWIIGVIFIVVNGIFSGCIWRLLGKRVVSELVLPLHQHWPLHKKLFSPHQFQQYFLIKQVSMKISLLRESLFSFSLSLGIASISRPLSTRLLELLGIVINSEFIMVTVLAFYSIPILAFFAPSVWILEKSGLRYDNQGLKTVDRVSDWWKHFAEVVGSSIGAIGILYSFYARAQSLAEFLGELIVLIFFLIPPIVIASYLYWRRLEEDAKTLRGELVRKYQISIK